MESTHAGPPPGLQTLAYVFLLAFAAVAATAAWDHAQVAQLERGEQTTAVGDARFFVPPEKPDPLAPAAQLEGAALYLLADLRTPIADAKMRVIGRTDDGKYFVYAPPADLPASGPNGELYYYLKTDNDFYIRLQNIPRGNP